tara:strand:- start:95 stop:421 length:327 start_codon:yes stop_codon:yes gene_type:complete
MSNLNTGFMFFPNRLTSKTTHGIVPFTRVVNTDNTLTRNQQILELRRQRTSLKKIGKIFNLSERKVKQILLDMDHDFEVELAQELQIQNQINFIEMIKKNKRTSQGVA